MRQLKLKLFLLIILFDIQIMNAEWFSPIHYLQISINLDNNQNYTGYYGIAFGSSVDEKKFMDTIKYSSNLTNFILAYSPAWQKSFIINTDIIQSSLGVMFSTDCHIDIEKNHVKSITYLSEIVQNDMGCVFVTKITKANKKLVEDFTVIKKDELYKGEEWITFYYSKLDTKLNEEIYLMQLAILADKFDEKNYDFLSLLKQGVFVRWCRGD